MGSFNSCHGGLKEFLILACCGLLAISMLVVGQGPDADGTTPLHKAVLANDLPGVQKLLRSGANPSASNRYGVTPLSLAAVNGNPVLVEILLKAGADVNQTDSNGWTALICAAAGEVAIVKRLVDSGANTRRAAKDGTTARERATAAGHTNVLELL